MCSSDLLAPGRELELLDSRGRPQLTLALDDFVIERDPAGRPEQFRSRLRLIPPAPPGGTQASNPVDAQPERAQELGDERAKANIQLHTPTAVQESSVSGPATRPSNPTELQSDGASGAAPRTAPKPPRPARVAEISVNHPLRDRGLTLYQADWALAALNLRLGRSPVLQVPLQSFPQLEIGRAHV